MVRPRQSKDSAGKRLSVRILLFHSNVSGMNLISKYQVVIPIRNN